MIPSWEILVMTISLVVKVRIVSLVVRDMIRFMAIMILMIGMSSRPI